MYAKGRGIVLNEPSVIALNSQSGDVLATGREAWHMIGRTPGYIVAVRPLRKGAITDYDITEKMIRLLLQRAGVTRFSRPRVVICVPSAITEVERRAGHMHRHDDFRLRSDRRFQLRHVHLERLAIAVDEDGHRLPFQDHIERGHEGVRRQNHLVTRTHTHRRQ